MTKNYSTPYQSKWSHVMVTFRRNMSVYRKVWKMRFHSAKWGTLREKIDFTKLPRQRTHTTRGIRRDGRKPVFCNTTKCRFSVRSDAVDDLIFSHRDVRSIASYDIRRITKLGRESISGQLVSRTVWVVNQYALRMTLVLPGVWPRVPNGRRVAATSTLPRRKRDGYTTLVHALYPRERTSHVTGSATSSAFWSFSQSNQTNQSQSRSGRIAVMPPTRVELPTHWCQTSVGDSRSNCSAWTISPRSSSPDMVHSRRIRTDSRWMAFRYAAVTSNSPSRDRNWRRLCIARESEVLGASLTCCVAPGSFGHSNATVKITRNPRKMQTVPSNRNRQ